MLCYSVEYTVHGIYCTLFTSQENTFISIQVNTFIKLYVLYMYFILMQLRKLVIIFVKGFIL